ncbi:hypothetical protein MGYG_08608 [Nannizzia gypsea CBS 118893]|uniref:Uncharacterized protein n=1 Tax=Arthroderma gypseum (strain ATCC MYA-4604 / CBS 118893) TaxID=535722 RepID=E4V6G9_ARTGP|nr:hypothetical protein MGYG_08608 [Nannizzia gypsea CBS 118893]EFQ96685.1 hypothetical protein MGYG_08608 [Nannizzia gypsea CBS 118893]
MEPLTGFDVLAKPLPPVLTRRYYQTNSSAYHKVFYKGGLAKWNFEKDVLRAASRSRENQHRIFSQESETPRHPYSLHREQYLCGDEQSVCGRFAQNALGPATAVAFLNGIQTRFGDFKVCDEARKEKSLIPDFVGVSCSALDLEGLKGLTETPNLKIVGEAKTPWKHNLFAVYKDCFGKKKKEGPLRHALDSGSVLYVSSPILDCTSADASRGVVSVRQCLYYLLYVARNPDSYIADNTYSRAGRLDTPEQVVKHMSPAVARVASTSGSIDLHSYPHMEVYTAILQFNLDDIIDTRKGLCVLLDDQQVRVNIKRHKGDDVRDSSKKDVGGRSALPALTASAYGLQQPRTHDPSTGTRPILGGHTRKQPNALQEKLERVAGEGQITDRSLRAARRDQARGIGQEWEDPTMSSSSQGAYSDDSPSKGKAKASDPAYQLSQQQGIPYRPAKATDKGKASDFGRGSEQKFKGKGRVAFDYEPEDGGKGWYGQGASHDENQGDDKDKKPKRGGFFSRGH